MGAAGGKGLTKMTTKMLFSEPNSPNPYKSEAYDLEDRKKIQIGVTKVNTAYKGEGCEAGRGFVPLNQVEKERAE